MIIPKKLSLKFPKCHRTSPRGIFTAINSWSDLKGNKMGKQNYPALQENSFRASAKSILHDRTHSNGEHSLFNLSD